MFLRIVTILAVIWTLPIQAISSESIQCHKVIIAGDSQWPPYTIVKSRVSKEYEETEVELTGVGIDLAKKIFAELDVPIQQAVYEDPAHMMQGLRDGEIDLIVSTYKNSGIAHDVLLLEPAYMIDPITVAVPRTMHDHVTSWDNLFGLNGIKEPAFIADDQTNEFMRKYLHVTNNDFLLAALQSVINGVNKYIIGSDLQLTYAIHSNHMSSDLIVMKNLLKGGDVHMAFAKNSACKQYAVYVQKRLQDYKNNGTVEKTLYKYIN